VNPETQLRLIAWRIRLRRFMERKLWPLLGRDKVGR
jgi:hypothetical protein